MDDDFHMNDDDLRPRLVDLFLMFNIKHLFYEIKMRIFSQSILYGSYFLKNFSWTNYF